MADEARRAGWDAQAIRKIVADHYGKLIDLFEAHGWPERGAAMMPAQQSHVARFYGSIAAFELAHVDGIARNALLDPKAAIAASPPDVWLTSYYGFDPESWGCLGFTVDWMRDHFLRESRPGALVVIYGAGGAAEPSERGRVLGIQQQSRETGPKWDFLNEAAAARDRRRAQEAADREQDTAKKSSAYVERLEKWQHAVRTVRAWRVPPERRPSIQDFAPESYWPARARVIGAQGVRLSTSEARGLLKLDLVEVPVFGGEPIDALIPGPAERVLCPSRPGPVAQTGYSVREAEGPKHLYILRLDGGATRLLDDAAADEMVVKVGFSGSPETRCEAHNRALPECAISWRVHHTTATKGRSPFPSSRHALAGEQAMKDLLAIRGKSLGGEFFRAGAPAIDSAWRAAIIAAETWKP